MTSRPLTILFWPESAYGPTNQCIGIGKLLRERGHRVVFAAESSWRGKLEPYGFEEELVDLAEPPEGDSAEERHRSFVSQQSNSWLPSCNQPFRR
jgi:UDP:flavonoid glycosyltransferase YjiC (YdhE family)